MTTKLEEALALAARGFKVFPLKPAEKPTPELDDWPAKATADPDAVKRLWTCPVTGWALDRDIGIATGGGLLAVDIDVKNGKPGDESWAFLETLYDVPDTLTLTTRSGGRHKLFRTDRALSSTVERLAAGIDTRGERGFIKWHGTIDEDRPLADCPAWLEEMIGAPRDGPATRGAVRDGVTLDTADNIERAIDYLQHRAPDAPPGSASNATYLTAACVKDLGISEGMAVDLMLDHWHASRAAHVPIDDISAVVANAYLYGRDPVGSLDPNADFTVPEGERPTPDADFAAMDGGRLLKTGKRKLYSTSFRNIQTPTTASYLVKGLLGKSAMSVVYGASNTGKSYVLLDLALHISLGWEWRGHRVRKGLVVYIAAEGGEGTGVRLALFRRHYDLNETDVPFELVPCSVDLLTDDRDVCALADLVRDVEHQHGEEAVLIVIDTLSRAMGGGNENAPEDMTKFIRHVDALRQQTKAHVSIVHHSGKDAAKGARGHSSLRAATDTEIEIAGGIIKNTKQRDMALAPPYKFHLEKHTVAVDDEGDPIEACVVTTADAAEDDFGIPSNLTRQQRIALEVLQSTEKAKGEHPSLDVSTIPGGKVLRISDWLGALESSPLGRDGTPLKAPTLKRTFRRIRDELAQRGLIGEDSEMVWRRYP